MDQAFIEKMKKELLNQRKTILESLAGQSDDMRELVKTVESGDEADVAADAIDRTLLTALGSQDAKRLQQIDNCSFVFFICSRSQTVSHLFIPPAAFLEFYFPVIFPPPAMESLTL